MNSAANPREHAEDQEEGDPDANPRLFTPCRCSHSTSGVQRQREEQRDQQPAQDVTSDPQDVEHAADCDQDPEHARIVRARKWTIRSMIIDTKFRVGLRFLYAPSGESPRGPLEEELTLPDEP